ncbi:hypothetical protein PV326_000946, partial [Microctonus aethiopoides]
FLLFLTYGLSNDKSVPEYFFREVTTPIHETHRKNCAPCKPKDSLRFAIASMLSMNCSAELREDKLKVEMPQKLVRCDLCTRDKDRKTKMSCCACKRPMCHEH